MARDYDIKFMELGQVKEKQFILIDDVICKIDTITKSKPGKHGAAKIRLTATAVFTGQKTNLLKPSSEDVEIPILDKGNAQIIADLGNKFQVMDMASYQTYEVDKDEFTDLVAGNEIEYLKAGAMIKISRKK
jgi:translation initiation factor 5A